MVYEGHPRTAHRDLDLDELWGAGKIVFDAPQGQIEFRKDKAAAAALTTMVEHGLLHDALYRQDLLAVGAGLQRLGWLVSVVCAVPFIAYCWYAAHAVDPPPGHWIRSFGWLIHLVLLVLLAGMCFGPHTSVMAARRRRRVGAIEQRAQADPERRRESLLGQAIHLCAREIQLADRQHDQPPGPRGLKRLAASRALLEQVLATDPDSWLALWWLGKIEQRLGHDLTALEWLEKSAAAAPDDEADPAREACLQALHLGDSELGIRYGEEAVRRNPDDHGHESNLALAYLVADRLDDALQHAEAAVGRQPDDPISRQVLSMVLAVRQGTLERPSSIG